MKNFRSLLFSCLALFVLQILLAQKLGAVQAPADESNLRPLLLGQALTGFISPFNDKDTFVVTNPGGKTIFVKVTTSPKNFPTTIAVVDPFGKVRASNVGDGGPRVSLEYIPAGTYTVVLGSRMNSVGGTYQYSIALELPQASHNTKAGLIDILMPPKTVLNEGNAGEVKSGPTNPTRIEFKMRTLLTSIQNYHWNNGNGTSKPGKLGLRSLATGKERWWQATGVSGQGGVPNAYWQAKPLVLLPPGIYQILDSEPETWACNSESNGRGFSVVAACDVVKESAREMSASQDKAQKMQVFDWNDPNFILSNYAVYAHHDVVSFLTRTEEKPVQTEPTVKPVQTEPTVKPVQTEPTVKPVTHGKRWILESVTKEKPSLREDTPYRFNQKYTIGDGTSSGGMDWEDTYHSTGSIRTKASWTIPHSSLAAGAKVPVTLAQSVQCQQTGGWRSTSSSVTMYVNESRYDGIYQQGWTTSFPAPQKKKFDFLVPSGSKNSKMTIKIATYNDGGSGAIVYTYRLCE